MLACTSAVLVDEYIRPNSNESIAQLNTRKPSQAPAVELCGIGTTPGWNSWTRTEIGARQCWRRRLCMHTRMLSKLVGIDHDQVPDQVGTHERIILALLPLDHDLVEARRQLCRCPRHGWHRMGGRLLVGTCCTALIRPARVAIGQHLRRALTSTGTVC